VPKRADQRRAGRVRNRFDFARCCLRHRIRTARAPDRATCAARR
jgi:hypothetical protein